MYSGYLYADPNIPKSPYPCGYMSSPNPQLPSGFPLPPQYQQENSYYQSMLPANLLSTPSPYPPRSGYFPMQHPSASSQSVYSSRGVSQSPIVPYLTHPAAKSGLDHLNLSRTVIFKNLSADLTLNALLSVIDHGPIEYCKMFSSTPPSHIKDVSEVKTCYISFVNTNISVSFFHKYTKSSANLRSLKEKLNNSKYLKLSLNEPCSSMSMNSQPPVGSNNLSKQDFIKLKTLNYILEYNATRCITIKFEAANSDLLATTKERFRAQASKFGVIEDFKSSVNEHNLTLKLLVHFTSIDAAIKVYEYYSKQVQRDHVRQVNLGDDEKMASKCLLVKFHRDRCDRTELSSSRHSSTSQIPRNLTSSSQASLSSSPKPRRSFNSDIQNIPEHSEIPNGHPTENNHTIVSPLSSPQQSSDNLMPIVEEAFGTKKDLQSDNTRDSSNDIDLEVQSQACESLDGVSVIESQSSSPVHASVSPKNRATRHYHTFSPNPLDNTMQQGHPMYAPVMGSANMLPMSHMHPYQYNPDPFNVGNRTIFLGNLHPYTQVEEIANNVRAGGLVESINFIKSKRMCFITFIDPAVALKFYLNHQVLHQLIIHGNDVKVSWGRNHSGPLNRDIALAVTAGASRNVYIGVKGGKTNPGEVPQLPDEQTLRKDFSNFGELEQINFYHNKDCGFINFMNISNAIRLVELMNTENVSKINAIVGDSGEFYDRYKKFKISFGKDRCGNPPKFSFKKKNASFDYFSPSELDLGNVSNDSDEKLQCDAFNEKKTSKSDDDEDPAITEEAAMVFGISTSPARQDEETSSQLGKQGARNIVATNDKDKSNVDEVKQNGETTQDGDRAQKDQEEEEEDDDEDDDISIIIGSDVTTSSIRDLTPQRQRNSSRAINHVRDANDNHSQHWYASKNSSTLSLNSNHRKYSNHYPPAFSPMPQSMYLPAYPPPSMPGSSRSGSFYNGGMDGSVPHLPHHNSYSGASMPHLNRSHSTFSGSQVMAQYLAKAQHDNFIYATNILANDVTPDEVKEYSSRRFSKKSACEGEQ
ncbi:hypothetical protein ACI3LY_000971 [Candidozyma auris]|uniref:RRM domain-containing protein n=2 Tax=Candidozyma auris TaxID=498019 RepID=A0A2H1A6Y3_CANAR|nr:hypothetical protein B9J08_000081 [[Candida] auris]QWW22971.1 hypothetical protein CA7LBN_001772 [[Candida] auris]